MIALHTPTLSKVLYIVTFNSKCARVLTLKELVTM